MRSTISSLLADLPSEMWDIPSFLDKNEVQKSVDTLGYNAVRSITPWFGLTNQMY